MPAMIFREELLAEFRVDSVSLVLGTEDWSLNTRVVLATTDPLEKLLTRDRRKVELKLLE